MPKIIKPEIKEKGKTLMQIFKEIESNGVAPFQEIVGAHQYLLEKIIYEIENIKDKLDK